MKVTIPKPCHENWAEMNREEKGRFCKVCSKSVRDFTGSSDLEIMDDLSTGSNICGNFRVDQLDRNLSHSFINSLFTKFAVGFILTSGGIVSAQTIQKEQCEVKNDVPINIKGEMEGVPIKFDSAQNQKIRIGGAVSSQNLNTQPLYLLDGNIIEEEDFSKINPNTIKQIEVLKGTQATSVYGAKSKYGAILITSKKKKKK